MPSLVWRIGPHKAPQAPGFYPKSKCREASAPTEASSLSGISNLAATSVSPELLDLFLA